MFEGVTFSGYVKIIAICMGTPTCVESFDLVDILYQHNIIIELSAIVCVLQYLLALF